MDINLQNVTSTQAFEWVKTGHWNKKQFIEWFGSQITAEKELAFDNGYDCGSASAEMFGARYD